MARRRSACNPERERGFGRAPCCGDEKSGPIVFTGIPATMVDDYWPQAEPLLWRAIVLTGGDETLLSVKNDLRNANRQLWAAFSDATMTVMVMALTTRLVRFGSGRQACEIAHLGGNDMRSWLGFLPVIEAWARAQGCSKVRLIGRRGWVKMLPSYEESATVLERSL